MKWGFLRFFCADWYKLKLLQFIYQWLKCHGLDGSVMNLRALHQQFRCDPYMWHEALLGKIIGDGIQLFVSIDSLFLKVNLRQSLVWRLTWIKVSWSLWEGWRTWMIWFVSWATRWVVYLLLTFGCLWGHLLNNGTKAELDV